MIAIFKNFTVLKIAKEFTSQANLHGAYKVICQQSNKILVVNIWKKWLFTQRFEWRRFGVFIVNFEHISHLVLMFLLLTLSR